ncbi:MAG: hypothetical protein JWO38_618 [Gemmataceae bacterium]|nr:hypothetical protein [Gemmataceae bacterium]
MNSEMIDAVIRFGGMALIGLIFTLVGYRKVGSPPGINPALDAWHRQWGKFFRTGGPLLLVVGAGFLVAHVFSER